MPDKNFIDAIVLSSRSDKELLRLRAALETEMRERNLAYEVGEVGELLAVEYFNTKPNLPNLMKVATGTKNVDAISRDGDRYSIKTVCRGKKTGTVYPDPDNINKQLFEHILIVILDPDRELQQIYQMSWDSFTKARSWDKRMNAWYISISSRSIAQSEVIFDSKISDG